ncbi:MAG: YjfB family protein [Phycisphaerales bacterium]|nr:YjfB family protein [Phycisphaerales bacterium]
MDVNAIAAQSTAQAQQKVQTAVSTATLKLAQDAQKQIATALLDNLEHALPSVEPGKGALVDVSA